MRVPFLCLSGMEWNVSTPIGRLQYKNILYSVVTSMYHYFVKLMILISSADIISNPRSNCSHSLHLMDCWSPDSHGIEILNDAT